MKKIMALILSLLLLLGLAMPAAAATAKATTMRLQVVEGTVTVLDASGVNQTFNAGMRLYSGYSIATADASYAYISLDDTKAIKLDMNTRVSIKKSWSKLSVELISGEIFFDVTAPLSGDETLEIRTSTMVTGIRGSSGYVTAKLSQFLTGHGTVTCFDPAGRLRKVFAVEGGEGVRGFPLNAMDLLGLDYDYEKIILDEHSFPAFVLEEIAKDTVLQDAIVKEDVFDLDELLNQLDDVQKAEEEEYEQALQELVLPPKEEDSGEGYGSQIPLFEREDGDYDDGDDWDDNDDYDDEGDDDDEPEEPVTEYTVTWSIDGEETSEEYESGSVPSHEEPVKENDAQYSYEFIGWSDGETVYERGAELPAVIGDVTYTAVFDEHVNYYTVIWRNWDGEILEIDEDVPYGSEPSYDGQQPMKDADEQFSYTFDGWDPEVETVTGDAEYAAVFSETVNTYTVTWSIDEVVTTQDYEYGQVPSHEEPEKQGNAQYSYTFTGWNDGETTYEAGAELPAVQGNVTYTAVFQQSVNSYTVTWSIDEVVTTQDYEYGQIPSHEEPEKKGNAQYSYTFTGWNDGETTYEPGVELPEVTGNVTYTAVFQQSVNTYTVTWSIDGTITAEDYEYGQVPSHDNPVKQGNAQYSYTFTGWNDGTTTYEPGVELPEVQGDVTYTAVFQQSVNSYTVTWSIDGTNTTEEYEYGQVPSHDDPEKEADEYYEYAFTGWTVGKTTYEPGAELPEVIGDVTYTAEFEISGYLVTVTVPEGTAITVNGQEYSASTTFFETPETLVSVSYRITDEDVCIAGPSTFLSVDGNPPMDGSFTLDSYVTITVDKLYEVIDMLAEGMDPDKLYAITGTVSSSGAVTIFGEIYITASGLLSAGNTGEITSEATIISDGDIDVSQMGSFINNGDITMNADSSILVGGWGSFTNNATLTTAGAVTVERDGTLANSLGATFTVETDGVVTVEEGGTLNNYGTLDNNGTYNNYGNLGNYGTNTFNNYGRFNNYGSVQNGGSDGSTIYDGIFNNGPDAKLMNYGSIVIGYQGSSINNDGFFLMASSQHGASFNDGNYTYALSGSGIFASDGGFCGADDNASDTDVSWYVDNGSDTLIIEGSGAIKDYAIENRVATYPWDGDSIAAVEIGEGITRIGSYSFYGFVGLTEMTVPDSVTEIRAGAFEGCTNLTALTLGSSLQSIGSYAFSQTGITELDIPGSVKTIGSSAFNSCRALRTLTIGSGVTDILESAFESCTSLQAVSVPDTVTVLGDRVFSYCTSLARAGLGGGITAIPGYTFNGCSALTVINIPGGVESIGDSAFYSCTHLTAVELNEGLVYIQPYAFSMCSALQSLTLPDTVESIEEMAFNGCTNLVTLDLGSGVKSIAQQAFANCSSISELTVPDSVTYMDSNVFSNCSGLSSLVVGSGLAEIPQSAFIDCSSLRTVTINGSLTSIQTSAFSGCTALESINIPDTVTNIGISAFENCSSLSEITLPGGLSAISDSCFSGCSSLADIDIPSGVTEIGGSAFENCSSLGANADPTEEDAFAIPDSVTSIGPYAFRYSGLQVVIMPQNIESIGDYAFQGCEGLLTVAFKANPPTSFGTGVFNGCFAGFLINIPANTTIQGNWYDSPYYDSNDGTFAGYFLQPYNLNIHVPDPQV